ncbi:unnamed protein product [Rotaria magnacalcarata]
MVLTNAQKQKRYRENLKVKGLHHEMKVKHAKRMKIYRQCLTGQAKQDYDKRHAESQRTYRNKKKISINGYSTKQSLAKAIKKATHTLPKDLGKKKEVVRVLAQTVGILPRKDHQRTTRKLSSTTQNSISLGRTVFADVRPKYVVVKSSMAHRVCVCIYHENVNLLLNSLCKHVNGSVCSDLHSFTSALVCDESNYDCMSSNCFTCANYFDLYIKSNAIDKNTLIKWYQWKYVNGYATKQEQQGSVEQCIELLSSQVKTFLLHVYIKRQQYKFFEESKVNSYDKKIVIQVDYSENFEIKQQDEIQSAHWSCKSISIFTAHAWSGTDHYSFALVSDNISHDKYCINNCITYVIKKMQKKLPSLEEIIFFSDGAASQFKQRYLIRNLARMSNNFSFLLSWHFFATSHAKGVVDGIGGTVKRLVWQQILTKKEKCEKAVDFVNIAKSKTKVIIIDEITQEDIDKSTSELHSFFSNTASVKVKN